MVSNAPTTVLAGEFSLMYTLDSVLQSKGKGATTNLKKDPDIIETQALRLAAGENVVASRSTLAFKMT